MTAEKMIAEVLDPDIEYRDGLSNDLLREFYKGYPIENLKLLIYSKNQSARGTASFIATELGKRAAPLLEDIATLLDHTASRARYDALETLWKCATYNDGWAIAAVMRCLEDTWPGVRSGAIDAIRLANRDALLAGFKHLKDEHPDSVYAKFRGAFLKAERGDNQVIERLLSNPDPIIRRFAVGLASRPRLVVDAIRLELAIKSTDSEVSKYGDEAKTRTLPPWSKLSFNL